MTAPLLDTRTRIEVVDDALELAEHYVPDWGTVAPPFGGVADPSDPGRRLIDLFARLAEVLIDRLNRVPERNFLSFLQLTGIERCPGAPAEAPVTFTVSRRAPLGGQVPERMQVATTQTQVSDARIFETRRAFFATPAVLEQIVALSPGSDRFATLVPPVIPPTEATLNAAPVAVFDEAAPSLRAVDHVLYIASAALFGRKDTTDVNVTYVLAAGTFPTSVVWKRFDKLARAWVDLAGPITVNNSVPGEATITFPALSGVSKVVVDGVEDFWLAGHFNDPFTPLPPLPVITTARGTATAPALPVTRFDAAFFNADPLDTSKPYYPFGRRPAYGDAFYFSSETAFAADVDQATLTFTIRPYVHAALQSQFAGLTAIMTVTTLAQWQYLDNSGNWIDLVSFNHTFDFAANTGTVTQTGGNTAQGTFIGAAGAATVTVTLSGLQGKIGLQKVNGVDGRWLRVLLKSQNPYGIDGVVITTGAGTPAFIGPLFIPPSIENVSVSYLPTTTPVAITQLRSLNDFDLVTHSGAASFAPFRSPLNQSVSGFNVFAAEPALYFAFDQPFGAVFISLYFHLAGPLSFFSSPLEGGNPNIAWEYWSIAGWKTLDASDDTLDLTTSGTVGFVGTEDAAPLLLFAQLDGKSPKPRWWFRARLVSGHYDFPPRVIGIYVNTVIAYNKSTLREDLLIGSSNGEPKQTFALVRAPVLGGSLWVRESERPSADEVEQLEEEHEEDAAEDLSDVAPGPVVDPPVAPLGVEAPSPANPLPADASSVWVRWRRVPNFLASEARSRHYTLDAVVGITSFGDGTHGLIPPIGRNNLVFREFETGGGEAASRDAPALAIKELKTTLPFIDKVFNVQAAAAGASPWTLRQLEEFGPQELKNRGRSVTVEDYEWMVRQRFSHVARVRCLPTSAPAPGGGRVFKAGAVTVLIVPNTAEKRPQPSPGLMRKVREFLARTALANIRHDIYVMGPEYAQVDVEAVVVPTQPELASVVTRKAIAALDEFLHPLIGGEDHQGYTFGRAVYLSEVHALLERVDEIDHVVSARFPAVPGQDVFPIDSNKLASSGTHHISV